MKTSAVCARLLAATVLLGAVGGATAASAGPSLADFQTRLAPHGRWLVSARHGNVWQPSVSRAGWNPYYDGHWEYTDVGQTWVSDYPWGAVPYHYGTWVIEPGNGWVWIPGDTWAPSWVVFRTGPDFIGWAPVAPGFVVGGALSAPDADGPAYVFVPSRQFYAPRVRACVAPSSRTKALIKRTKIVQNTIKIENHLVVNRGPSLVELQRATGKPVRAVRLETVRCLAPGVGRREIRVDAARARSGVRAVAPSMTRAQTGSDRNGNGTARTAYDREIGPTAPARTTRVAHQDVYDRDDRATRAPREDPDESARDGETQSDRDVRLLASREKTDRARAETKRRPTKSKSRS